MKLDSIPVDYFLKAAKVSLEHWARAEKRFKKGPRVLAAWKRGLGLFQESNNASDLVLSGFPVKYAVKAQTISGTRRGEQRESHSPIRSAIMACVAAEAYRVSLGGQSECITEDRDGNRTINDPAFQSLSEAEGTSGYRAWLKRLFPNVPFEYVEFMASQSKPRKQ